MKFRTSGQRALVITVALTSTLVLASCGTSGAHHASSTRTTTAGQSGFNALTGLPGVNGPVLFVKVDDTPPAHPQVGLRSADVVYIEQVEGGLTRLAAVFSNALPAKIGPVRSARISDIDLMAQYGRAALAFSGAQTLFLPVLDAANIEDIGADHEPASIYSRDQSRAAPTNMFVDPAALLHKSIAVEKRTIATAQSIGWSFGSLPTGGTPIVSATLKWPTSKYQVVWSQAQSRWLLNYEGRPDLDSQGIQLGSPTFIIQEVSITNSIYHDHVGNYTPFSNTVGSGTGYLLRDGQKFPILWNRPTPQSPTTWTLTNGQPAPFHTGQVWVALTNQAPVFQPTAPTGAATAASNPASSK
jgi:hypothetical protein